MDIKTMISECILILENDMNNYSDSLDYIKILTIFKLNETKYNFTKEKTFSKKYRLIIELFYLSFKFEIPIFKYHKNTLILHNFHKIFEAISLTQRLLMIENSDRQDNAIKYPEQMNNYAKFLNSYVIKINTLNNLNNNLRDIIDGKVIKYTGTPFQLVNSYLQKLSPCIEQYDGVSWD